MENVKLTIWFSTYNQKEYVAQALDSMLAQKTNFKYKIIAADDCSTDGTREIIKEYREKYPEIIQLYFPENNLGGCRKLVNCINEGLFEGEYVSFLEGDDYWIGEDKLQFSVDFLEKNPKYSRIAHQREVVDEDNNHVGYDLAPEKLNRDFYIEDFLKGDAYSDFGGVFRNYFSSKKEVYDPILLASTNVVDFQDMFITQDCGPVYVVDKVFGAYRVRTRGGGTNYNSITSLEARSFDHIRICRAVEKFYEGKYDLSPMVLFHQKRILTNAVEAMDEGKYQKAKEYILTKDMQRILPEIIYLKKRGKKEEELAFLQAHLTKEEKKHLRFNFMKYSVSRIFRKLLKKEENTQIRGYKKF